MIDHWDFELILGPMQGVRVGALARQKEYTELRQIIVADECALRVFLLDGAEGGWRGEHNGDAVLGDDAPEDSGVTVAGGTP